ncbi:branched-chain amino acid ABC transporter permease [Rhodobacterales bacterium HKCCE3408]|nr:branched-chain amino acid ABC transporter permease [Rhodobacterales bacterium HKCCE3408]
MQASSSKSALLRGLRAGGPFVLVAAPFGTLFGIVGTEAGLDFGAVMAFSTLVIAGASQFTAVQLMSDHAPMIVVLASALAVNLRMAMYSAALQPHIGAAPLWQRALIAYSNTDQSFAVSLSEYEEHPERSAKEKATFFLGTAIPVMSTWVVATWVGVVLGAAIPPELALDFALPVTFLSLIGPALKTRAHVGAAIVSVVLALALAWIPFNLGLILAALGAMATGAELERRGYGR